MLRQDYIECSVLIMLSFISLTLSQDLIIVANPNMNETLNSSIPNGVIPESLLIQLKDVRNISDLLQRFIISEEDDTMLSPPSRNGTVYLTSARNGTYSTRKGLAAAATATVAHPANCQTDLHVIELDKPENAATVYWPNCVRVKRCSGCCTSKMLECKPLATSVLNITVLKMYYNIDNPGAFESQGTILFSVEQHDRCACSCKEGPEDCDPNIHDYRANECRCVCKNSEESASCTGRNKMWSSKYCSCLCRNIRMCSTGRFFNTLTCRCEISRRSLGSNYLVALNLNTSSISQESTASP